MNKQNFLSLKTLFFAAVISISSFLGIKGAEYIAKEESGDSLDLLTQEAVLGKDNFNDCTITNKEVVGEDFTYVGCNNFF
jgi:hypothetical protein